MDVDTLDKEVEKNQLLNNSLAVVLSGFFLLTATEFFCVWLWYMDYYQRAWWKHSVSWGGLIVLVGLFAGALLFCFFSYKFLVSARKLTSFLSRLALGKFFIPIFFLFVTIFSLELLIVLKPGFSGFSFLQTINKHPGLLYLATIFVGQILLLLIVLKIRSNNIAFSQYLFRQKGTTGETSGRGFSYWIILLRKWMAQNEFLAITIAFVLLIFLFFAPTLLQGKLPLSTSYLYQFYPWAFYKSQFNSDMVFNNVISDDYDSGIPAMKFVYTEIQKGNFPFWIPYVNSGIPYGILMFSSVFSLHGLSVLIGGLKWGTILYMCLKIYIAGIFMYYYLRLRQFAKASAFFGSLVLMFSADLIVNGMAEVADAIIYAPAILYFAERFIQERKYWQFFCLVISVTAVLMSGFPSVIMYTILLVAGYLAYRNLIELKALQFSARVNNLTILSLAFLIGVLLLTFTLLPTYEFFKTVNIEYRAGRGPTTFDWVMIGRLVNPNICGNPIHGNWLCTSNYNETALYVGLFPLMLIPFSFTNKRHVWTSSFFFAVAVLILLIVFGVGTFNYIVGGLPLFSVNPNTRMIALLPLCFAFISATGLDGLTKTNGNKGYLLLIGFASLVTFSFWAFDNIPLTHITKETKAEYYLDQSSVTIVFLLVYFLLALVILIFKHQKIILSISVLLLFLNFIERAFLMGGYQGASYPGTFYPETPATSFLQSNMPKYERVVTVGQHFIPSFPLYYSINSLSGHAFADVAFKKNLELINPGIYLNDTTQPLFTSTSINLMSPLLDAYRVRYIVTSPLDSPIWFISVANQREYNQAYVLNNIKSFGQSITIERDGYLDSLEVRLSASAAEMVSVNLKILTNGETVANFIGQLKRKDDNHYSISLPNLLFKHGEVISIIITPSEVALPADSSLLIVDFDGYKYGSLIIDGEQAYGDMAFDLFQYDPKVAEKYKLVHTEDLAIYENTTLSSELPVITKLKYSSEDSCAATLSNINPLDEAVVEDKNLRLGDVNIDSHARIREYGGNNILIDADVHQVSMIILSDTYDEGWQATVDGEQAKIYRVNCAMRGVVVPPGKHTVKMSYIPPFFKVGVSISLLTFLGLIFVGGTNKAWARNKHEAGK
ncbi:MAG: YfhO family protein [Anaerolineales bacterium]